MRTRQLTLCISALISSACAGVSIPIPAGTTSTSSGGTGTVTPASGNVAADVITYTNRERAKNGLPAFRTNVKLMEAAAIQARQMAAAQRLDHVITGAQYPTPASRLDAVGYDYSSAAENVAWNQPDAPSVVQSWMASTGHRANILDRALTEIGAAMARSSKGEPYWVQVFGSPR
jgi:uncharacterized protein YkwD